MGSQLNTSAREKERLEQRGPQRAHQKGMNMGRKKGPKRARSEVGNPEAPLSGPDDPSRDPPSPDDLATTGIGREGTPDGNLAGQGDTANHTDTHWERRLGHGDHFNKPNHIRTEIL